MSTNLPPPSRSDAPLSLAVDTRISDSDVSGQLIQRLPKEQRHSVASYHVVKDDPSLIQLQIALATINPVV